jgi:hypothetical protein
VSTRQRTSGRPWGLVCVVALVTFVSCGHGATPGQGKPTPAAAAPGGGGGATQRPSAPTPRAGASGTLGGGGAQSGASSALAARLPGHWLDQSPGPPGQCGNGPAEWFFQTNGSYSFHTISSNCGGTTAFGTYQVRGDMLALYQPSVPGCPTCQQVVNVSVRLSFVTPNDMQLCDLSAGCYLYHRQ